MRAPCVGEVRERPPRGERERARLYAEGPSAPAARAKAGRVRRCESSSLRTWRSHRRRDTRAPQGRGREGERRDESSLRWKWGRRSGE
eukprot:scaffold3431_cov307-Prasinococcus_capsulatus_cf.AAC.1